MPAGSAPWNAPATGPAIKHVGYAAFMDEIARFVLEAGISERVRGCTEPALQELTEALGRPLPEAWAAFLREMGEFSGPLYGSDHGLTRYALGPARAVAAVLTSSPDCALRLTDDLLPLAQHHASDFIFIDLRAGDDPPVHYYLEGQAGDVVVAPAFTAFLRQSVLGLVELEPRHRELLREQQQHYNPSDPGRWQARLQVLHEYDAAAAALREALVAELHAADLAAGRLTGPAAFQALWQERLAGSPLHKRLLAEGKRLPYGWLSPQEARAE